MFGSLKLEPKGTPATDPTLTGIIEKGSEFEGKLSFSGTFRINGRFKGQILTPDTLVIGPDASVSGEIEAGAVIISGEFTGTISARYRVEIQRPAVFKGDILTPSLSVQEGVIFEGRSKMGSIDS
jgi:cytoskeletal protein CcmA (bactofilin family)